ncbi:hypothetical protein BJ741DRAFT_76341 [Chytriomyces cf. hyalinus JEL632]|nr:hypothetical protein BJ741DRAFT_76341 [Chytriomyces cf. hyalinus JEL632]
MHMRGSTLAAWLAMGGMIHASRTLVNVTWWRLAVHYSKQRVGVLLCGTVYIPTNETCSRRCTLRRDAAALLCK